MKRAARFFVRLYPAQWRQRYGEEFETLIEDSSPGWRTTFDVVKGAIRMQLHVPSFPKLALLLSLAGVMGGLGLSMVVTPFYLATAEMQLSYAASSPGVRPNLNYRVFEMEEGVLSHSNISAIIQRFDLYNKERSHIDSGEAIERMRQRDIRITVDSSGPDHVTFRISFTYPDRMKASYTVQALVAKFAEVNQRIEASARAAGTGTNLVVIEAPSTPTKAMYPDRVVFAALGFGAGFATAIVIAVLRRRPPAIPFPAQTA